MKTTGTSQKVMDRIMSENRWAIPVHKHEKKGLKNIRIIGLMLSIFILLGITVSFIFIHPMSIDLTSKNKSENITANIKSTDFAKTFTHLDYIFIQEGTVASIGEPLIYNPESETKYKSQMFWMLSILGISMITLFLSWLSGEKNNS